MRGGVPATYYSRRAASAYGSERTWWLTSAAGCHSPGMKVRPVQTSLGSGALQLAGKKFTRGPTSPLISILIFFYAAPPAPPSRPAPSSHFFLSLFSKTVAARGIKRRPVGRSVARPAIQKSCRRGFVPAPNSYTRSGHKFYNSKFAQTSRLE